MTFLQSAPMRVACLYFRKEVSLAQVAEHCLRLSPQISLGASAVFIEIGKCRRLYTELGFHRRVQVILRQLGATGTLGLGVGIPDSLLRAKFRTQNLDELPLAALLDIADPFQQNIIVQQNIQKMILAFSSLGIQNLGQFQKIPLPELINRFGAISLLCIQRLRNEVQMPWPHWRPVEVLIERSEFPYFEFYGELEPLLFKLKEQLDQLFQRLWARNLRLQRLQVRVFFETNSFHPDPFRHFEFEFITPQSTTKATLNILKKRLSRDFQKKPVKTPIEALEIKVLQSVPGTTGQKNILHNHEEQLEQFQALLGQLGEAHGRENIFHAELTEDRRPEKSWRKKENILSPPYLDEEALLERIPQRPTHLLKRPEKIQVRAGFLFIRQKKYRILKWPPFSERLTGGWQDSDEQTSKSYARNYLKVEIENAPAVFLFQTEDQNYYLHGYFA